MTKDFEACEFWLENTLSDFDSENVEFLFEFRKPENVLVGSVLELEKLTIYTSQADDLNRFNENLADGMSKTGLMKVMRQKSFLQASTCKEDSINKMFAEYPRSQSAMTNNMKHMYLYSLSSQVQTGNSKYDAQQCVMFITCKRSESGPQTWLWELQTENGVTKPMNPSRIEDTLAEFSEMFDEEPLKALSYAQRKKVEKRALKMLTAKAQKVD